MDGKNAKWILSILFTAFSLFAAISLHAEKKLIDRLPKISRITPGFDYSSLLHSMSEAPLHHIEGIWQFPATGVTVAISRQDGFDTPASPAQLYSIVLVFSPNRAMRPGTVMGLIAPMAGRGEYEANIYTSSTGSKLTIPRKFTLLLSDDDSSIKFKRHKSAFSVNLWRLLPYLWRYTVTPNRDNRENDGCVRIFPEPPLPREPIYL